MDGGFFRRVLSQGAFHITIVIGWAAAESPVSAACMSLVSGPVVVDIAGCKDFEPEKVFDTSKPKYQFIGDLDSAGRTQFLNTYRGLFVKAKVVKSKA